MSVYIEDEIPSVTKLNQKSQTIQASSPVLPTAGQLWYDTANGQKQYDGSSWIGMKFGGDVYVQANKILTTGYQIFEATTANSIVAPVIEPQGTTADGALVIKPAEHGTNFYNSYIYIRNRGNITGNGQELRVGITANEVVIDSQRTLNTVPYIPMKIRMAGNDIITLNIDNSINANSRVWSNFIVNHGMIIQDFNGVNGLTVGDYSNVTGIAIQTKTFWNDDTGAKHIQALRNASEVFYVGSLGRVWTNRGVSTPKISYSDNTDILTLSATGATLAGTSVLALASNKITTAQSHQIYSIFDASFGYVLFFDQQVNAQNPAYIFRSALTQIPSIQIHRGADFTNYERIFFGYNGAGSKWLFGVSNAGTGVLRALDFQMGGNSIITLNTDNTVNANSRAWSNFVLGNNMDAGSNRLTKVSTIHFDPTNVDTDSTIMGNRSSTLSICATANGTVGQSISLRTSSVVTAGAGTPLTRLTISGGASTTNITISNANLQLNTNKFYMNANTVYMSYWGGVDSDIAIVRTDTTNNYSGLYIIPNGTPSSTVARLAVNMLDVGDSNTNRSRIELLATATSGTPQQFALAVTNAGTGSLYPFKIQMSSNDIITFNTDNSVNANSRLWSNFKLGGQMDANGHNIANALLSSPIISGTVLVASPDNSVYSAAVAIRKDAANLESNTFALHNEDVGANAGVRILGVTKTSDGSLTRTIGYIYMDSTAKVATQVQNGKLGIFLDNNSGVPTEYFNILGGATGLATFSANVSIGANKLQTTNLEALQGTWIASPALIIENQTTTSPAYIVLKTTQVSTGLSYNLHVGDNTNYQRASWEWLGSSKFIINSSSGGTGTLRPFEIQMSSNAILTFNIDNSVNANSRLWSNFKLGGAMDANAQFVSNVGALVGRTSDGHLDITSNVAVNSGQIFLYTGNAGSAVVRMTFAGNAAQGSSLITSFEPFQFESYHDAKVISAPSNPASGYVRIYPKATDANNDDLYMIHKVATAMTEEKIATGLQGAGILVFKQKVVSNFMSVNSTGYLPVNGFDNSTTSIWTTEGDVQMVCPVAGTIKNLYVSAFTSALTLATTTITVRKNGSDTALTTGAIPTNNPIVGSDTTHSFTVAAGDLISIKVVISNAGTGSAGGFTVSLQYVK